MSDNSEILELYAKEALERGLISEAQEEPNPRYDSNDIKAIEALYGVNPNGEDDDVLDKAHPEPVIVSPAYDRVNGLVENLKERQNVIVQVVQKPTDGKHTQKRYVKAQQELFDAVKTATFLLERKNEDAALIRLADACSESIVNGPLKSVGWISIPDQYSIPLLTLINAPLGAVSAIIYAVNWDNIIDAADIVVEKLAPLINGSEEFRHFEHLSRAVEHVKEAATVVKEIDILSLQDLPASKEDIEADPKSAILKMKSAAGSLDKQKAIEILNFFDEVVRSLARAIPKYIQFLIDKEEDVPLEWGDIAKGVGMGMAPLLVPGAGLLPGALSMSGLSENTFADARNALENFLELLNEAKEITSRKRRLISQFAGKKTISDEIERIQQEYGMELTPASVEEAEESLSGLLRERRQPREKTKKEDEREARLRSLFPGYSE